MIPQTFPSTYAAQGGQQQMVVVFLSNVAGLQRWLDYIPVKLQGTVPNSYDNNGFIPVVATSATALSVPFRDYIPVFVDAGATDAWQVSNNGFIPYNYLSFSNAALNLDLLSGSLDSRVTFTRASGATRFNASGVLETVATNVPRFDHDPVTLAPRGLLIEGARTNLLLNSATLATQNVTVTAVAHTLSFYGTGTVTLSGVATGTLVGSGAFPTRSTLTFTPTAGTLTLTVTGSVTLAQLEVGAFASSYIPTTSSQVTRAADVAVMTGTNFSSWYNQSQGTFFAESSASGTNYFATSYMVGQAAADSMRCIRWDDGTDRVLDVRAGNVLQASATTSGASASATKYAGAYAASNFGSARSGTLTMSTTTGTVPLVDRLFLGSTAGAFHLFGHIRRIAYWNTRLTNAELQSLTS